MKDLNYSEIYERIFGFFSDLPNYFIAYQGDSFLAIFFQLLFFHADLAFFLKKLYLIKSLLLPLICVNLDIVKI